MLSKVCELDESTINQIAAGEVIENPSSVVKELVENSIDAGSSKVIIEIKAGGRQQICVTDDGLGMNALELQLCLKRHATSKISHFNDLEKVGTLGFRGEAIPSIAAVSQMKLRSATASCSQGMVILVEGGKIVEKKHCAPCRGTRIEVKSLFYNVPVRKNFQKSIAGDVREIIKIVTTFALAYPYITFELIRDGRLELKTKPLSKDLEFLKALQIQMKMLLDNQPINQFCAVAYKKEDLEIQGYISSIEQTKPNRLNQSIIINGRTVEAKEIAEMVDNAYGTALPKGRFSQFILHFRLPSDWIDVNVHPQKKQIRIREEEKISSYITESIHLALEKKVTKPNPLAISQEKKIGTTPLFVGVPSPVWHLFQQTQAPSFSEAASVDLLDTSPSAASDQSSLLTEYWICPLLAVKNYVFVDYVPLKDALNSFFNEAEGILIVDYKRLFFRYLWDQVKESSHPIETQILTHPVTLHLSLEEVSSIEKHLLLWEKLGFEVQIMGKYSVIVYSCPSSVPSEQVGVLFQLLLEKIRTQPATEMAGHWQKKYTKMIAEKIDYEESEFKKYMQHVLIKNNPTACPEGKKIMTLISVKEMKAKLNAI